MAAFKQVECTDQRTSLDGSSHGRLIPKTRRWTGEMRTHDIPTVTAMEFKIVAVDFNRMRKINDHRR